MNNCLPLVSVIMPVFNSATYLRLAIDSILKQTYENIELLIVDDASTDNSIEIIKSFSSSKIRFFKNEKNIGVSATRNKMIDLLNGKYIALMDSDDISPNYRIEKQVDFLEKNSEYGLIGGHYERFSKGRFFKKRKIHKHSLFQEENQVKLNFLGSIAAPTAMFRTSIIRKNNLYFDTNLKIAEDYDFWRKIGSFTKVTNIDEILLYYRKHSNNTMNKKELAYRHTVVAIRKSLDNLEISNNDIFDKNEKIKDLASFFKLINKLETFVENNKITKAYNQIYLEQAVSETIIWFYKSNLENLGFKLYSELKKTRYLKSLKLKIKDKIYLSIIYLRENKIN